MRRADLSSLRGVTPALLTPLTEDGRPDAAGIRRLVEHVIAGGVQGLLPLGSTGETASLDPRSRREVLERVVEVAAGRVPVICGVAQPDLGSAQADVAAAAGRGAVAALVAPPFYYPMDQAAVLEFYRRLARESAIPILAYNIPQLTKVVVEPGTVGRLAGEGVLAGIKDSSRDFEYFQQVALATRGLPDFLLFTGTDAMLLASVVVGASGTICASANIAPGALERLYQAAAARDLDRARELQDWIVRLVGALRAGTFPAGVKAAAELLGLCGRWAAPPASALDEARVARLRDDLVSLGVAVVGRARPGARHGGRAEFTGESVKEERRVRCAVVGLGQGLDDVNVIVHHPRLELAAICDSAPERYDWLTGRTRIEDSDHELARNQAYRELIQDLRERPEVAGAAYHQDYQELLRRDDVDSVSIVVGDPLHEAFTTAALAAGKYALCTKPMALTMGSAWNIASAARQHAGRYMLALQMGYSPLVRTISTLIEEGALGRLRQLGFHYHRQPWRPVHSFRNAAIDGVFLKEGVHWFDMIYRICGMRPFRSVAAFGGIDGPPGSTDFEDNGVVIVDYGDFRATHGFSYFRRCRRPEELIIAGDGGTLRGTFSELDLENGAGQRRISIPAARLPRQRLAGYEDMYDAFAAMVLDGQEPYSNWQTALENMLTAYAAQLAISRNGLVTRRELAEFDWRTAAADAHH